MATISGFSTLYSVCRPKSLPLLLPSSTFPIQAFHPHTNANVVNRDPNFALVSNDKQQLQRRRRRVVRSVAEETLIPEEAEVNASATTDQPVAVSISPSDVLTMFFQVRDLCKFFWVFEYWLTKFEIWECGTGYFVSFAVEIVLSRVRPLQFFVGF